MFAQLQFRFEDVDKQGLLIFSFTLKMSENQVHPVSQPTVNVLIIFKDRIIFHSKQVKAHVLYDQKTEM